MYKAIQRWGTVAEDIATINALQGQEIDVTPCYEPSTVASVCKSEERFQIVMSLSLTKELNGAFLSLFRDALLITWLKPQNTLRNVLRGLMSEISSDFAFHHEVGHILGGHADAMAHHGNGLPELELVKRGVSSAGPAPVPANIRRVWEYEADVIAAGHLAMDAASLIRDLQKPDAPQAFRDIFGPPQIAVEQVSSLFVIACYTLFRQLRETATSLDLNSFHPDPLVRAFVVRDALYAALSNEFEFNDELFEILLGARFEEFDDALEAIGIRAGFTLDDDGIETVNLEMSKLVAEAKRYRRDNPDLGYVSW